MASANAALGYVKMFMYRSCPSSYEWPLDDDKRQALAAVLRVKKSLAARVTPSAAAGTVSAVARVLDGPEIAAAGDDSSGSDSDAERHTVEDALAVLKARGDDADLVSAACDVLHETCDHVKYAYRALKPLIAALRAHADNFAVAAAACRALSAVCWRRSIAELAGDGGAVEVVGAVLQTHRARSAVVSAACSALERLCAEVDNADRAREAEALESVAFALRVFDDDPAIAAVACSALCRMCSSYCSGPNARLAGEAGAVEAAVKILRLHSMDGTVTAAACKLLRCLCDASQTSSVAKRHTRWAREAEVEEACRLASVSPAAVSPDI